MVEVVCVRLQTGQWVDISDLQPEARPEPEAADEKRKAKRRTRRAAAADGSLFGGMLGGDGSGDFDVQPADELIDFEDVGGMEQLKAELRDSVGLMLEHPDDAARYGIEWNGILLHGPSPTHPTSLWPRGGFGTGGGTRGRRRRRRRVNARR